MVRKQRTSYTRFTLRRIQCKRRKESKILGAFGYLTLSQVPKLGILDPLSMNSLRTFQRFFGLPQTGTLDERTATMMNSKRCGNTDNVTTPGAVSTTPGSLGPADYVIGPCQHPPSQLVLSDDFLNYSADPGISPASPYQTRAITNAINAWHQYIPPTVLFHGPTDNSFAWYVGDHGDGVPFDGPGNVLAHTWFPCGGNFSGQLHFDNSENWTVDGSGTDLQTVATHEYGHGLGMNHSTTTQSVMYPTYQGINRSLYSDDIQGIQSIYGALTTTFDLLVHLQDLGDTPYRQNQFAGTRGESRRLEGFQINLDSATRPANLSLQYMAHLQDIGDTAWVPEGTFCGTRGESRRVEGFAVQLTGSAASNYNVFYMAHLEDIGDTDIYSNGAFCGTRGQSRRLEGLLVKILPK